MNLNMKVGQVVGTRRQACIILLYLQSPRTVRQVNHVLTNADCCPTGLLCDTPTLSVWGAESIRLISQCIRTVYGLSDKAFYYVLFHFEG